MTATLYDTVPYPRHSYGFTHPDRLATLATLHGLNPPPIERARVLELGCASGSNLAPMAYALPEAEFVGVDLSARQIDAGRRFIADIGLWNIRLEALDLRRIDDAWGRFDYIIAHGVYSWVPPEVGRAILQICATRLSDGGVALVSYNAYPGCHPRQMVRAMGQFHTRDLADPQDRADQLRAMTRLLVASTADDGSGFSRILRSEADRLAALDDAFLLHDVLEEANYPCYFHEFVSRAAERGLQYLCEAMPIDRRDLNLPPETLAGMQRDFDFIELEQHLDFLQGTAFRRTLLCREGIGVQREMEAAPLERLLIASPARPVAEAVDLVGSRPEEFVVRKDRYTATLRCDAPIEKAALVTLGELYPRAVPLEELIAAAALRIGCEATADDRAAVRRLVLGGSFPLGAIELHAWQPAVATSPGERPIASAVTRREIAEGCDATTLWHERLSLTDPLARELVLSLDGNHDRPAIIERLTMAMLQQQSPGGETRTSPTEPEARREIARRLEPALADLARAAILVG